MNSKKVALVVGCGGFNNIGWATVVKLMEEGYHVIGSDIELTANIPTGPGDEFYPMDATDKQEIERVIGDIERVHGRLDVIVNSAGVNILGTIDEYAEEDFDKTIAVNLKSNFLLLQAFVRHFDDTDYKKSFVVVGSDTGMIAKSATFAYGASKAGVQHFVRCAARELNKYHKNWVVTALAIGMVAGTPMDNRTIDDLTSQRDITEEEAREMLTANIPTGRGATPAEVAGWLHFLATDGEYATGNVLKVDSGQLQG